MKGIDVQVIGGESDGKVIRGVRKDTWEFRVPPVPGTLFKGTHMDIEPWPVLLHGTAVFSTEYVVIEPRFAVWLRKNNVLKAEKE